MADQRVSMFVSHKMDSYGRAAHRIKAILESRTERLDVDICEEIFAGDRWRKWVTDHIKKSEILLVLWPHTDDKDDPTWIAQESGQFQALYPDRRLVVLKPPSRPIPEIFREYLVIDATKNQLVERFLKPLYRDPEFVSLDAPLNKRITDADIQHDAQEIEQALRGMVGIETKFYGESLVVETSELEVITSATLDDARVRAPHGCRQILNWDQDSFLWKDLRKRAEEDKGKGTFWVSEMEEVITEVANKTHPRVMTSTFRGRGQVAGQIFGPRLVCVDFVADMPVRYHFAFHEELVPELVRGPASIGVVFNLLHVATRTRWEVLNPFLVKLSLGSATPPSQLEMSQDERGELIGRVIHSLRAIQLEAERHNMLALVDDAFEGNDRKVIGDLLKERERIYNAIAAAGQRGKFEEFMGELIRALDLNCTATDLLANRFLELVRGDNKRVRLMMPAGAIEGRRKRRSLSSDSHRRCGSFRSASRRSKFLPNGPLRDEVHERLVEGREPADT
jgi:hypothetical protein